MLTEEQLYKSDRYFTKLNVLRKFKGFLCYFGDKKDIRKPLFSPSNTYYPPPPPPPAIKTDI